MTLEEIVKSRRSVRRYTDEPVPQESLMKLLDLARWAPYASECWRFVVVQDQERKERLAKVAQQKWIATAPVIIVVGADLATRPQIAARWDAVKFRDLFPTQETSAAIQNLMLAAVEEGLGTCWIGSFNEGGIAGVVDLPFAVRPVALLTLGYPADKPPKRTRKPLEKVVFWETFSA